MNSPVSAAVTVIIPVFNAFSEARRCLESVLRHRSNEAVLVIDDASTAGIFSACISDLLAKNSNVTSIRHERNLGFVASCNEGMCRESPHDVVLLNSDTIVTKGWLTKLSRAAYSRPRVGTVTPLTNNGTVCSVPSFFEENEIPPFLDVDQMGVLVENVSAREYPKLPTCVGFCVYIKREVLERVGLFDEAAFGKGYGEENDFSLRAQKLGFADILDDATFVYHEGSKSFSEQKQQLQVDNSRIIAERYPRYFGAVQRFRQTNPLRAVHDRIEKALIQKLIDVRPSSVLHILHNGPTKALRHNVGGTERVVQKQIESLGKFSHFSLVCADGAFHLTCHIGAFERTWRLKPTFEVLQLLCAPELFSIAHVHHTRGFEAVDLSKALRKHSRVVVSAHDHSSVCPRFYLLTPELRRCGLFECHKACGFEQGYVDQYRKAHGELLKSAKATIHFSSFSKDVFEITYGALPRLKLLHHVVDRGEQIELVPPENEDVFRVALVGTLAPHKGLDLANQLAAVRQLSCGKPLELRVFGGIHGTPLDGSLQLSSNGAYHSSAELREQLKSFSPHVALFPSLCPETFGLAVEETLSFGVPVIVGPEGGPAERVQERQCGWVLNEMKLEPCLALLNEIAGSSEKWSACRDQAARIVQDSRSTWAESYEQIYKEVGARHATDSAVLWQLVSDRGLLARDGPKRILRRAVSHLVNQGIQVLDRCGVRAGVERLARTVLPTQSIERLRALRH